MKRITVVAVSMILATAVAGLAQGVGEEGNKVRDGGPRNLVSANLFSPIIGFYSGSYELAVDDHLSAYVSPRYFNYNLGIQRVFFYDENFSWWSLQSDFGVNYYLEGALEELYVGGGPVLGYERIAYDYTENDSSFTASASGLTFGAQAHVGYRFIFDFISIAPQAGLRYTATLADAEAEFDDPAIPDTIRESASDVSGSLSFPLGIGISIAF